MGLMCKILGHDPKAYTRVDTDDDYVFGFIEKCSRCGRPASEIASNGEP